MLSCFLLRYQRQYVYLGFVIRNASLAQWQNFLVTMTLIFFAVPAPALLFSVIVVCTVSVFIPIENPHLTIVHFGKTPRVYTQPDINLCSMLKHQMRVCTIPEWLSVLSSCIRPLFSVAMMQNDIGINLQKVRLSTLARRVLPSPTFQEYITCVPRNSASTLNGSTASSTPSWPLLRSMTFRKASKYGPHT